MVCNITIVDIEGKERVTAVTIAQVGPDMKPIPGTEERYTCDTLLLSTGLIPENELSRGAGVEMNPVTSGPAVNEILETSIPGVFACGNVLHVHDLVDYVSAEGKKAGKAAADYVLGNLEETESIKNCVSNGVSYMVPQSFHKGKDLEFMFRVNRVFKDCYIHVYGEGLDKRIKKMGIVPSEMQKVSLKKEELEKLDGELKWEVVE